MRRQMRAVLLSGRFHRIQACCPAASDRLCKTLAALGLGREAVLPRAAAGGVDDLAIWGLLYLADAEGADGI